MENIERVQDFKLIDIGERKFKITKFDARRGSFILFKVMGVITPLVDMMKTSFKDIKSMSDINLENINFTELAAGLTKLDEKDFTYIQDNCLKVCYEILGSGDAQVLNDNGTYGVIGLERDTKAIMTLTIHAIVFNVSGFFGGSLLNFLKKQEV